MVEEAEQAMKILSESLVVHGYTLTVSPCFNVAKREETFGIINIV